jgi:hypothetical protein
MTGRRCPVEDAMGYRSLIVHLDDDARSEPRPP